MSRFGFCSPHSFSFTFPRPPAIFNSVIMAYSVGTWHSLSPTLHSCPWFSCGQRPILNHRAGWKLHRCQARACGSRSESCFLPTSGSQARAEDGGPRQVPQTSQLQLGSGTWLWPKAPFRTSSLCRNVKQGGVS